MKASINMKSSLQDQELQHLMNTRIHLEVDKVFIVLGFPAPASYSEVIISERDFNISEKNRFILKKKCTYLRPVINVDGWDA